MTGTPASVASLSSYNGLRITKQVEVLEAFTGFETKNRYTISNLDDTTEYPPAVLIAKEDSSCCERCWCGICRALEINVSAREGDQKAFTISRDRAFGFNWCMCIPNLCCQNDLEVAGPDGALIGRVTQKWATWRAHFEVTDANNQPLYEIVGPCCNWKLICCCTYDREFQVLDTVTGEEVSQIRAPFAGWGRECFTDAGFYEVQFTESMLAEHRALLLAAGFLIDVALYEKPKNNN